MKRLLLLCIPFLMAGKCGDNKAPPIVEDKCVVDVFEGTVAKKQTCVYKGYNYACTSHDCTRTGEATGELPK